MPAGMSVSIKGGDDRYYNNLFVGNGEALTSDMRMPMAHR
jgi:hypothetical protein